MASSAAGTASACRPPSCVTTRQTVTTAVTRPPARPSPAVPHPSSATTPCASRACGPATVTPTAPTAQTNGPAPVVHRDLSPPSLIRAHPWSSAVAAGSASTAAGSAMEDPTASTDPTKLTVVRKIAEFLFCFWLHAATSFNLLYSSKFLLVAPL